MSDGYKVRVTLSVALSTQTAEEAREIVEASIPEDILWGSDDAGLPMMLESVEVEEWIEAEEPRP